MSEKLRGQGGKQGEGAGRIRGRAGRTLPASKGISSFLLPFVSLSNPKFTINLPTPSLLINVDFPAHLFIFLMEMYYKITPFGW